MYQPSNEILEKYAKVLVNFALNDGNGVKEGETIFLSMYESAKPFLIPLQKAILESGANLVLGYLPDGIYRDFYEHASDEQLAYSPKDYLLARVKVMDHSIAILSDADLHELEGIDSKKIMERSKSTKYFMEARDDKERAGKFTWTLALYGTEAMAKEAGLTLEEYWQQIINACFLDFDDPIAKWREVFDQIQISQKKLNDLPIDTLHIFGKDVDLNIKLGEQRAWKGGDGRNIPSFEIFTSPDWRGTNGWIKFNQPLYRYGTLITGVELEFKDGVVVSAKAEQNEQVLKDMIAVENADKVGEFSMTDKRFSRITKFMAETLFDENMGGDFGNSHIALGKSYTDCFNGDQTKLSKDEWKELGYNDSVVHTDIVTTSDRTVEATLKDGSKVVIYKDGMFVI